MSESPAGLCLACSAPMAEAARFCSRCGSAVDAARHPPRWPELKVALQLWVLLVLASGGVGVAMHLAHSDSPAFELTTTIALVVLVVGFALPMRRQLAPLLSPARVAPRALVAALLAAAGLLVFIHLYLAALSLLGLHAMSMLDQYEANQWPLWSALLLIGVAPAVFEEIGFRGIIHERLLRVGGPREALVLQAAMFSIIHLLPASFVSHFVIGLVLGWLRQRTRSLLPGMVTHYVYNATLLFIEMA